MRLLETGDRRSRRRRLVSVNLLLVVEFRAVLSDFKFLVIGENSHNLLVRFNQRTLLCGGGKELAKNSVIASTRAGTVE